jgi:hypothetical protein
MLAADSDDTMSARDNYKNAQFSRRLEPPLQRLKNIVFLLDDNFPLITIVHFSSPSHGR